MKNALFRENLKSSARRLAHGCSWAVSTAREGIIRSCDHQHGNGVAAIADRAVTWGLVRLPLFVPRDPSDNWERLKLVNSLMAPLVNVDTIWAPTLRTHYSSIWAVGPPRPLNDRHTTPNPQWSDSPMCIHQRWGIVFKLFWGAVHHRWTQWEQITLHMRHMLLMTWKWRLWRIHKLCCVMMNALIMAYASVGEGKGVARFSGASLSALHAWDNPPNQVWHPCLGKEAPLGGGRCSVWRLSVWGHL